MEWLEEPNLAKSFNEMIRAEQNLEQLKQQMSLRTDFNIKDCYAIFDLQNVGLVSKFQFEEVYTLFKLYPST